MQIIQMKGCHLVCPADWTILPRLKDPRLCTYAGVVEARAHDELQIPHFVFFNDVHCGDATTKKEYKEIFAACQQAWPRFEEILEMTVVGCFSIVAEDDENFRYPSFRPPYGAIVLYDD